MIGHFSPDYPPWDRRVCVAPDGDLFTALKSGKATVVTTEIDRFVSHGIRLRDGSELPAEIIVSATGLRLQVLGGMQLSVDGAPRELNKLMTYKGVLAQDLTNFASIFGGGNVSWTIKAELAADYVCRLSPICRLPARAWRRPTTAKIRPPTRASSTC